MLRLIEAEVAETAHWLGKSKLDPRVMEALSRARESAELDRPEERAAHLNLIQMLAYADNRHEVSIRMLRDCIRLDPSETQYSCNLAVTFEAAGRLEEAAQALDDGLSTNPKHEPSLALAQKVYRRVEREDDARRARKLLEQLHG